MNPEQLKDKLLQKQREIAEAQKDADAIERVLKMLGEVPAKSVSYEKSEVPSELLGPKISLVDAMAEAVALQDGSFTLRDIARWLDSRYPQLGASKRLASVSATLLTLVARGSIQLAKQGSGRRPSKYQKIPS